MTFTVDVLLTCILYCDAGPGCDLIKLFASTVLDSYHGYHVFLRRRRSFTSRKLYTFLEKFLCFSCNTLI